MTDKPKKQAVSPELQKLLQEMAAVDRNDDLPEKERAKQLAELDKQIEEQSRKDTGQPNLKGIQAISQAFALFNSGLPVHLRGFYSNLVHEGFEPHQALTLTSDLMTALIRNIKDKAK